MRKNIYTPIQILPPSTALKIAAGEVIEKPASVVRELLDNSIDSGASSISLELEEGGLSKIKVSDNGCGMTKEDLMVCTLTHSTSKIRTSDDLLHLSSLGFRGEALSSIRAVSDLEIISKREGMCAWKFRNDEIEPVAFAPGTSVEVSNLFANFPARRKFLKRAQYEGASARQIFIEKALPFYMINMSYGSPSKTLLNLPPCNSFKERCLKVFDSAFGFKESDSLFYEITHKEPTFSFNAVLGTPDVYRSSKKYIYVFVNGRRINEYGLVQAISYGSEGYFPNGGYPIVFLFLQVDSDRVDFNIHPAKKEVHFEDYHEIHRAVHNAINKFYKEKTIISIFKKDRDENNLKGPIKEDVFLSTWESFNTLDKNSSLPFTYRTPQDGASSYSSTHNSFEKFDVANVSHIFPLKRTSFASQVSESSAKYSVEGVNIDKKLCNFRVLGQFCGTFIAVEKNDALYIIDQHAAHERIIYEELKKCVGESQELLVPYILETSSKKQDAMIQKNKAELEKMGFRINEMEMGKWELSSIPIFYKGTQDHLLNDIASLKDPSSLINHLLSSASCRAACKDGDILDYSAMEEIVERAFLLEEPLCPHGRPIYFVLDKMELFRKVKRIT